MQAQGGEPAPFGFARRVLRGALVLFYGAAGIVHVTAPSAFLPIMPDWVPYPVLVIVVTGLCEIAVVLGLLTIRTRR